MLEMLTKKRNKKRKGFTLVELIVVIAILGILMLIAVPRFAGFRENSALKADQATAATIGKAAELHRIENPDAEPTVENLQGKKAATDSEKSDPALLDGNLKAQAKDKEGFKISYDGNVVKVFYEGETTNPLYPLPAKDK